ncbi:MAG TPA: hypothetical protein VLB01_05885 [Thermodesulfobacteriota bacterium]|nr:hypothetical protein [Thermodesulfobacteriota bacterium]
MRQLGLRVEILFNILFLTAVAMLVLGIIAFKVTERFALQGEISGAESKIAAFEALYRKNGDMQTAIEFLKSVLDPGAWAVISDGKKGGMFSTDSGRKGRLPDPAVLHVMNTGRTVVEIEG